MTSFTQDEVDALLRGMADVEAQRRRAEAEGQAALKHLADRKLARDMAQADAETCRGMYPVAYVTIGAVTLFGAVVAYLFLGRYLLGWAAGEVTGLRLALAIGGVLIVALMLAAWRAWRRGGGR